MSILFSSSAFSQTANVNTKKSQAATTQQLAKAMEQVESDLAAFEAQREHLQSLVDAAENLRTMENLGLLSSCSTDRMVAGVASGFARLQTPPPSLDPTLAAEILNLNIQVRDLVASAFMSGCAEKNDKCCKKSGKADENDACNAHKGQNCKLVGTTIKGCSETSDDCA